MQHPQPLDLTVQKQYDWEHFLYETLSREILAESNRIIAEVNQISLYRLDLKDQIEYIAIETFSSRYDNVEAHIYGSVATGLALPESDMDIVITGVSNESNPILHKSDLAQLYDQITQKFGGKLIVK